MALDVALHVCGHQQLPVVSTQLQGVDVAVDSALLLAARREPSREAVLTRRARTALGTATQCTRRND